MRHLPAVLIACSGAVVVLLAVSADRPGISNGQQSADRLAAMVLDAVARNDRPALEALALSEREFRDRVWPYLPAARPERNLPLAYVWGDLRQKSDATLTETLARHGGRRYALTGVEFAGMSDYGAYRVHREARLLVRDPGGLPAVLRLSGSFLEQGGRWKVFSYVVDD